MEAELGLIETQTSFNVLHSLLDFDYASTKPAIKRKAVYTIELSPRLASPSLTVHTPSLRALLPADTKNTKSDGDDDATLDLSESENYDELLHGDNSMDSTSKHLHSSFHSSLKSFADSWTTFVHDQPERLSSTTHRVSESISSTKDRVAEKIVTFAVEQMGKSIPGC
jgi:hypothetical protein